MSRTLSLTSPPRIADAGGGMKLGLGVAITSIRSLGGGATPQPSLPVVSIIGPTSIGEGTGGSTNVFGTATRTGNLSGASSVLATVSGIGPNPATAADFVGDAFPSVTLTWNAGQASPVVQPSAPLKTDATVEPDEGMRWTLSNPVGCTIGIATADTTILNDDAQPDTSIYLTNDTGDVLTDDASKPMILESINA